MADNEMKDNRGILFQNDRKESDTHPDYKGRAKVDGKLYWFSLWVQTSKAGQEYFSTSFQLMEDQTEKQAPKKDWIKPELREKFNKQDEVVLDDIEDEPVDLNDIPF